MRNILLLVLLTSGMGEWSVRTLQTSPQALYARRTPGVRLGHDELHVHSARRPKGQTPSGWLWSPGKWWQEIPSIRLNKSRRTDGWIIPLGGGTAVKPLVFAMKHKEKQISNLLICDKCRTLHMVHEPTANHVEATSNEDWADWT